MIKELEYILAYDFKFYNLIESKYHDPNAWTITITPYTNKGFSASIVCDDGCVFYTFKHPDKGSMYLTLKELLDRYHELEA